VEVRILPILWALVALLAGLMLSPLALAAEPGGGAPVIANGGFEAGKSPWWGKGDVVSGGAAEGNASMRVTGGFVAQDKRAIKGGSRYRISMRIRGENAPAGSVFVQLSYRGEGVDQGWVGPARVALGGRTEPALFVTGETSTWRPHSVVVAAPEGASELLLYLRKVSGTNGAVYFDAVRVEPTTDPVDTAATLRRDELAAELLDADGATPVPVAGVADRPPARQTPPLLTLSEPGRSNYRIQVAVDADAVTMHAAGELARYLQLITGSGFLPLTSSGDGSAQRLIVVGQGAKAMAALAPDLSFEGLGEDGFLIRTVGEHILIAGQTSRGTMYGVNWFLDRKLGVKWLSPSYVHIPRQTRLAIAPVTERQVPRFSYREVLSSEGEDKRFRAHNLLNGESHGPSFQPGPPEIDTWDRSWRAKGGDGTFWALLDKKNSEKLHPEWFAGGQVAMMNPDMRQAMAEAIIKRLKQHPDYRSIWFDIHDMDWGWDMDPASRRFAEQHGGSPAAPRLDMVIDVAERVRKHMPGARFAFNAYHWSFSPPAGMRVPDHVMVFPMTIHVDYRYPLNEGSNRQLGEDIAGWNGIAKNVLVWDHITNFSGFLQPTPNIYPIGQSIRWLATLPNVNGYFAEGSWNTPGAEFAALRIWLIARLLWNPDQDVRALIAEFCTHYYGAAGVQILEYIDLMHQAIDEHGDVLAEKSHVDQRMFGVRFIALADRLFDEAEVAVASDPQRLSHVRAARMSVDYVALVNRAALSAMAMREGVEWDPAMEVRQARFWAAISAEGVKAYRQDGSITALRELLAIERRPPQAPSVVQGLKSIDWVDFQELSFNLYGRARIVPDPQASDAAAARIPGNERAWAIHLKLDRLPGEGRWDLYARVRIDAPSRSGHDFAAILGAYPGARASSRLDAARLGDGNYTDILIPGGPFIMTKDHAKGIYIQVGRGASSDALLVDRIFALRHGTRAENGLGKAASE